MSGRGGDAPPSNGGEFLLKLLSQPPNPNPNPNPPTPSPPQLTSQNFPQDPAVAAVGPAVPTIPLLHAAAASSNGQGFGFSPWNNTPPPPFAPHNYFRQNPNLNPDFASPPGGFNYTSHQYNLQSGGVPVGDGMIKLGSFGDASKGRMAHQYEHNITFGSLSRDAGDVLLQSVFPVSKVGNNVEPGSAMDGRVNRFPVNSVEVNGNARGNSSGMRNRKQETSSNSNIRRMQGDSGSYRSVAPPPGFSSNVKNVGNRGSEYPRKTSSDHNVGKGKNNSGILYKNGSDLSNQLDFPGPSAGSNLQSVSAFDIEESMMEFHGDGGKNGEELRNNGQDKMNRDHGRTELDDLGDQLVGSLGLEDESGKKSDKKKHRRDKDYRADSRGQWIMDQRMRNVRKQATCRNDINRFNDPFLAIFKSLIPADEEKAKQKQLLTLLENLVGQEWPEARLYLYGSCANSFGFPKSDIDVCLAMELGNSENPEVLLKLADILQSDNLQNVQALTRARVPIVKLMDPVTGISCDICVNNMLAVVNTKLLHDYAQIDVRLRQLAFIVKHWAKSRGVNETYHGTLSSYAYVLMCIHFLQQRSPAILPCLQGMEPTYSVNVDNVECAYFDKVDELRNFGSRNGEGITQLVWAFFHYWAYCHDYAKDVISIRTGSTLSKRAKDWTRRVGNDRHLICIEDPFEVSHDLGRVVDKFSIRVIREEFERAAEIMLFDHNPCVTLFEPYIPN